MRPLPHAWTRQLDQIQTIFFRVSSLFLACKLLSLCSLKMSQHESSFYCICIWCIFKCAVAVLPWWSRLKTIEKKIREKRSFLLRKTNLFPCIIRMSSTRPHSQITTRKFKESFQYPLLYFLAPSLAKRSAHSLPWLPACPRTCLNSTFMFG